MTTVAKELLIPTTFESLDDLVLYLAELETRLNVDNSDIVEELETLTKQVGSLSESISLLQQINSTINTGTGFTEQDIINIIENTIHANSADDGIEISPVGNITISIGTLQTLP